MVEKRKRLTNFYKVRIAEYYLKNQASGFTIRENAFKFEVKSLSSIHDWIQHIEELRANSECAKNIKPNPYTH